MRLTRIALAAALAAPLTSAPAFAEGFSVRDLLETTDRAECLRRGERALQAIAKGSGGTVDVTEWIIYGWDMGPGVNDLTLMCPIVAGGVVNGFLVVYGDTDEQDRTFLADEILRNF